MAEKYMALYRKWRPKIFDDVVGQDHITSALRAQIKHNRTSHAYIFTGTRGTGKTTCAKVFARALCCPEAVDGNPCNKCPACLEMLAERAMDITEIDAASNNGVDNIRDLKEEAVYAPVFLNKRVYIIDEVHMLSQGAFNALLKTLEEPPEHVYFILATTEIHKVPTTILSRCQRFDFHRIGADVIAEKLTEIASAEGYTLEPRAAAMLAKLGDGSMRDAISLLDRSMPPSGVISFKEVIESLGIPSPEAVAGILSAVIRQDPAEAIRLFSECYMAGRDTVSLFDEMLSMIRDLLIVKKAGADSPLVSGGALDKSLLSDMAGAVNSSELEFFAVTVGDMLSRVTRTAMKRVDGDLCLIRLSCRGEEKPEEKPTVFAPAPSAVKAAPASAPALEPASAVPDEKAAAKSAEKPSDDIRSSVVSKLTGVIPPVRMALSNCTFEPLGEGIKITVPDSEAMFLESEKVRDSIENAAKAAGYKSVNLFFAPAKPLDNIESLAQRARSLGVPIKNNQEDKL